MSDVLLNGTRVHTVRPARESGDWSPEARDSRKWGWLGTVERHHDSHGVTYEVRHVDGSLGHYERRELETLSEDAFRSQRVDWLIGRDRLGRRAANELAAVVREEHDPSCSGRGCLCGKEEAERYLRHQAATEGGWEQVEASGTTRLRVPGGYLYRSAVHQTGVGLAFVPDKPVVPGAF